MLGLKHDVKKLMETCESLMSDNDLDCCQAVDRVYLKYFGFSPLDTYGLNDRRQLAKLMVGYGGLEEILGHILEEQGFIVCEPCLGSIAFNTKDSSCVIHICEGVYAQKSTQGVLYQELGNLRNWKCPK